MKNSQKTIMTEIQALLATNIKGARARLGLSQLKLAERCNFSTSFVGEIEIGRKFPSPKNLQILADALGLRPYQLFFDKTDWQQFDKFSTLSQFSQELKQRLTADIEEIAARLITSEKTKS